MFGQMVAYSGNVGNVVLFAKAGLVRGRVALRGSGGALDREVGFLAQRLGAEFIADELIADRQRLDLVVAEAERLVTIGATLRKRPDRPRLHYRLLDGRHRPHATIAESSRRPWAICVQR